MKDYYVELQRGQHHYITSHCLTAQEIGVSNTLHCECSHFHWFNKILEYVITSKKLTDILPRRPTSKVWGHIKI